MSGSTVKVTAKASSSFDLLTHRQAFGASPNDCVLCQQVRLNLDQRLVFGTDIRYVEHPTE